MAFAQELYSDKVIDQLDQGTRKERKKLGLLTFDGFIAGTLQEVAGTARLRYGVGHSRCHDSIDKSRLSSI